jgi:beta-aspartyl-peptidase (threonine type)
MSNWKSPRARLSRLSRLAASALAGLALALAAVAAAPQAPSADPHRAEVVLSRGEAPRWAIAIHGGAGVISRAKMADGGKAHLASLRAALEVGRSTLAAGGTSLDAVEKAVRYMEDDPLFNAGKGAVYNHEGIHELDAAIMDGSRLACGAVAAVKTVKNPISLARLVMERSPHVLLVGEGADRFAAEMGVERVSQDYFHTAHRYEEWQRELRRRQGGAAADRDHGTVGAVALDRQGNLAAATSTGGTTDKLPGRVGDSPIPGAGTYANNRTCAVSGTGAGEEFIRHAVAHDISALIEYRGATVQQAAESVVRGKLRPGDGGVIAVGRDGTLALVFNTEGMYRGTADSTGRFEVKIWD